MELRQYQLDLINQIFQAWLEHHRVLLQLATGAGKTLIAMEIIRLVHLSNPELKIAFVCHRKELLSQVSQSFVDYNLEHSFIAAQHDYDFQANLFVGMIQTMNRRMLPDFDLIILDEAHHACAKQYDKLVKSPARILSLTATPRRLTGEPMSTIADVLIEGPSIQWLIAHSYLAKPRIFVPAKTAQLIEDNRDTWQVTAGDFNSKAMDKFFTDNAKAIYGDVIEHYHKLCEGRPTLVFCPSIKSVYDTAQLFNDAGILSVGIDGMLSDEERTERITQFKNGEIKCLMNCSLVDEGFDLSDIYAAILLRPTKSLTVFLQQCGRALRIAENKHECILIDHCNNTQHFGVPWLQRYWSLEGYKARTKRDATSGRLSLKLCLICGNYIKINCLICPICGNVFKVKSKVLRTILESLKEITIESAQAAIEKQCQRILNREKHRMLKTKVDFVQFATDKGWANPEGWAEKAFAKKQADDKVYFNGTRDELIVLFTKQKNPDPAAKADVTLAKRAELQKDSKRQAVVGVYDSGTLDEIIAYLKSNRTDITNPEAYARGVMKKRLAPVFQEGTTEQVAAATAIVSPVDQTPRSGPDPNDDKFTQMVKFAKTGKVTPLNETSPRVLTDAEAEVFARNVVRKAVKADLDSGDPVKVKAAAEKLHVKNVEAFTNAVLNGGSK